MLDPRLPKISVVVTCYNCRDYIGDAIRSVARQTLRDFECVVVDDASTDDSAAVVRQLLDELGDPRFSLIRLDKNVGQTGATRRGLAATKATFVCFLDSDDLWNDDFLERHLAAHLNETYAVGFTACNARLIDGQGALIAGCVYWFGRERARVDRDQARRCRRHGALAKPDALPPLHQTCRALGVGQHLVDDVPPLADRPRLSRR
jgi:glycosyltransferase involved in cell wall biosynthesis